jgi:hypothetical protein
MSKNEDIKIKAGDKSCKDSKIIDDAIKINKNENLANDLGIFRLASVHRDLDLANQPSPNAVLVNLRIKFITKTDVEVTHVIPVMVTQGDDQEALTCYNGSRVKEDEFLEFYKSIKPEVKEINRKAHYHSEPFLAYYLCSKDGKDFLVREFEKKGLIAVGEDEETYESNVKEITAIGLDLHSTKVVCFNCGPFLKVATPKLLKSINWALVLPKDKRLKAIEFNVSANQNFDWNNISRADTFDHIPVLVSEIKNILTNTEESLGMPRVILQKVGEASNRTYFLSGSKSVNRDVIALRDLDEKKWQIVASSASKEIQRMWREFSERKKFKQKQVELKKDELSKVVAGVDENEEEIEKLTKKIGDFKVKLEVASDQKISVTSTGSGKEEDLNIFNYVGESTNLSYQNVLYLINEAFKSNGLDVLQTAVAVISEDNSLDYSLRNEILRFIGANPLQDRISIALCRGYLNEQSGQIEGNTHWTALHLRRIEDEDDKVSIKSYYMDSIGNTIPQAVTRVLESIKITTFKDLGDDLSANSTYQVAIRNLDKTDFNKCKILKRSTKQTDGYSCGYHTVFNMLRMHNLKRVINSTGYSVSYEDHITHNDKEVGINQFIEGGKSGLQTHFNPMINTHLQNHSKFSMNMNLNRALCESILVSEDSNLDKLKELIQLEKEIKKSEKDPAIVLSSMNLEKFYKKFLSQSIEQIRYKFLKAEECVVGDEDSVKKREKIFEKLSSSKTTQIPQDFLEILERIDKDPTLLSSSLDVLLEDINEVEKEQSKEDYLIKSMADISLEKKLPLPSPVKIKTEQLIKNEEIATRANTK